LRPGLAAAHNARVDGHDDDLGEELATWAGARIDQAHACPETGLVAIGVYTGETRILGAGIGPLVQGLGLLPRFPSLRAPASHPLVAAMRAHLVGHRVRAIEVSDDGVIVTASGEASVHVGDEGLGARLVLTPGRRGEARVIGPSGELIVRWPNGHAAPSPGGAPWKKGDARAIGADLVEASDTAAAARERAALLKAARARLKTLERRAEAVRLDLARLEGVDDLQRIGRLLVAQGGRIARGTTRATLQDWEKGGTVEVDLDPALPAKAQAEAFFTRARRFQRGSAVMRRRSDETERAILAARELVVAIEEAPLTADATKRLVERSTTLGLGPRPQKARGSREKPVERRPFHTFLSDARTILVGRGGADNDALTLRHARPHDLWLHAKGTAGAHVVVPLKKGESCPPGLFIDAATLAAHFSSARGELVAEVSYVDRRYVRKPKGSATGAVTLDREKVIAVRVEADRLERLLATKIPG
jgi:NFACT N-terminal and middle domains/NFACT protein RNA binding domain